jgi:hypothetical protein
MLSLLVSALSYSLPGVIFNRDGVFGSEKRDVMTDCRWREMICSVAPDGWHIRNLARPDSWRTYRLFSLQAIVFSFPASTCQPSACVGAWSIFLL